jgi:hypothetical protein
MRGIIAALACEGPAMNMTLKELGALERFVPPLRDGRYNNADEHP